VHLVHRPRRLAAAALERREDESALEARRSRRLRGLVEERLRGRTALPSHRHESRLVEGLDVGDQLARGAVHEPALGRGPHPLQDPCELFGVEAHPRELGAEELAVGVEHLVAHHRPARLALDGATRGRVGVLRRPSHARASERCAGPDHEPERRGNESVRPSPRAFVRHGNLSYRDPAI